MALPVPVSKNRGILKVSYNSMMHVVMHLTLPWVFLGVAEAIVGFCVVAWVLFSVFSIFCFTSFGDHTIRNINKLPLL